MSTTRRCIGDADLSVKKRKAKRQGNYWMPLRIAQVVSEVWKVELSREFAGQVHDDPAPVSHTPRY